MKIHYCEIANLMRIVDMREINNEKNNDKTQFSLLLKWKYLFKYSYII